MGEPDQRPARRMDVGRLLMVPFFALLLAGDVATQAGHIGSGARGLLHAIGAVVLCAFYGLTIWCYLVRFPTRATSRSVTAHIAAVVATPIPLVIPLLHGPTPAARLQVTAYVLVLAGLTWSVWALRWLGRNFSIIPQARGVAQDGPYRWVRHPLYAGEIVSALGVTLTAWSVSAAAAWVLLCVLQAYRARSEEQVLLGNLPGYRAYRARTAALIPGIF